MLVPMNVPNERAYDADIGDALTKRVMAGAPPWAASCRARTSSRRNAFGCNLVKGVQTSIG
jgi:hypothetical protein